MNIFIIIVTYNAQKWIDRCLLSINMQNVNVKTIIVDNNSRDSTVEIIKSKYKNIILLEQDENLGFCRANNIGIKYAIKHNVDYLYLLNQDTWFLQKNTISKLLEISEKNPEYYIVSPIQLNRCNKMDLYFEKRIKKSNYEKDLINDEVKDIYSCNFIMAAHWFMPIKTILKIGLFSPSFFHYGEDNNYIHRVKYFKGKIGFAPQVKAIHDRVVSFDSLKQMQTRFKISYSLLLSNPNYNYVVIFLKIINDFISVIKYSLKLKTLILFNVYFKGIKNTKVIIKNRIISKHKSAFLN